MNTFLTTKNEAACCGCLSCMYSCPTGSISLSERFDKFSYPQLDSSKCINCGICRDVCPNDNLKLNSIISTHALKHNEREVRLNSSSGGAFTAISDILLDEGYTVYGAVLDDDFHVVHRSASNKEERNKMRGSKYIESSLVGIYPDIKSRLERNEKVLFVGTPCQTNGLKTFLKKEYENLFTIDLVCNGVGSPKIFEDYLNLVSNGKGVNNFIFRYKADDKWSSDFKIYIDCESKNEEYLNSLYTLLFVRQFGYRPSCSECKFTRTERPGDLTIGDFWTINSINKDFNDSTGVSFVSANTSKGEKFLKEKLNNCETIETDKEKTIKAIPRMHESVNDSVIKHKFWKYYKSHSAKKTFDVYGSQSLYSKIRRKPFELLYKLLKH